MGDLIDVSDMRDNMGSGNLFSKVVKVSDLVRYQDGAVVSRTLIDEDAGTVTLFAFDRGQGLSEHTVPYDAIIFVIEGSASITVGGKSFNLEEGQMIIMPAREPHSVKSITRFKMILVMIRS
ncbi:MAG: cupin domain-containing protein [Nitrososphaeria archaeon]